MNSIAQILKVNNPLIGSNRLIGNYKTPIKPTNLLSEEVSKLLDLNEDVIEPKWKARHAKFIYQFGGATYQDLADLARRIGKNPVAFMAHKINQKIAK